MTYTIGDEVNFTTYGDGTTRTGKIIFKEDVVVVLTNDNIPFTARKYSHVKTKEDLLIEEAEFITEANTSICTDFIQAGYRRLSDEELKHLHWCIKRLMWKDEVTPNMDYIIKFQDIIDKLKGEDV